MTDNEFEQLPARKKLKIVVLADVSGSMSGDKIASLNRAMDEVFKELVLAADSNPFAELLIEVISFDTTAQVVLPATAVRNARWTPLNIGGVTALGEAITLLSESLDVAQMGPRNFPPVVVLLSDGSPTDDWRTALSRFELQPWGHPKRTIRVAVGIGGDADKAMLAEFTGSTEMVFDVHNASQLTAVLKWATVTLSTVSSSVAGTDSAAYRPPVALTSPAPSPGDPDVW